MLLTSFKNYLLRIPALLMLLSHWVMAAEEEVLVLSFDSDLIQRIAELDENAIPKEIIRSYYNLLSEESISVLANHQRQLEVLQPAYEVAFSAADSAELAEIQDSITFHWATINRAHEALYADDVVRVLTESYSQLYSFIPKE